MTSKTFGVISLAAALVIGTSLGNAAQLKIGDPAPKLQIGKWVQGDAVKGFEPGKVYVVEFWATWCGPCRASIPHLNALYQQFKDKGITVIGQDVWEEQEDGVAPFIKKMGTNMTYRVALDDKSQETNGAMAVTWMKAAGRNGIPSAFIVNQKGVIAWIGHPMEMDEKLWGDILAGNYDVAKAAADYEKREANQQQLTELSRKLMAAMKQKQWDDASALVDQVEKILPKDSPSPQMVRFQIFMGQKKYDEAYRLAGSLSEAYPDNAMLQNALAWTLVSSPGIEKRDPALAEKIAERANKATMEKEPAILDTLARAQFMNGKKDKAITTQQKAIALAQGEEQDAMKKTLQSYQDGKLPDVAE